MKFKAILVTGSRRWSDRQAIYDLVLDSGADVLIHGDHWQGADAMTEEIAHDQRYNTLPMPAQWREHGKSAGPRRNREMLAVLQCLERCGYDIEVHGFPTRDSRGTYDMMDAAAAAGVEVHNHGHRRQGGD